MKTLKKNKRGTNATIALVFAASALFAQQNGLNNGSGLIELGGPLIRNTDVTLDNGVNAYNMVFNGEGIFGVGNNLNAATLTNPVKANFTYNNPGSSSFNTLYGTIAAYYNSPAGTSLTSGVRGIQNIINADAQAIWGYESFIKGDGVQNVIGVRAEVETRTAGGSGLGVGVIGNSSGAATNFGGQFAAHTPPGLGNFAYSYGVYCGARGEIDNYGGFFKADSGAFNRGVYAETRNIFNVNSSNIAVHGLADGVGNVTNSYMNIGVLGVADNANDSYGVAGYLSSARNLSLPGVNAAIYGNSAFASTFNTPWAGYFDGNVNINGNVNVNGSGVYTGTWSFSDKRVKKQITPITNSAEIIGKLQPKSFMYNTENEFGLNFSDKKDYGIIAQELEQVLPELVRETQTQPLKDKDGKVIREAKTCKIVNYNGFIGILIANAQEQQKQLDEQKQLNDQLTQRLEDQQKQLEALQKNAGLTGSISSNPGSYGFAMSQNEPNPFSHETRINYTLTGDTKAAVLNIYDLSGKQISSMPLTEKGSSSILITSDKLAAGIYIYSIVADGKIMDTKRMVVAEK